MVATIKALFPSRREVELAVEHLVKEYGIGRNDIFVEPAGRENSSGVPEDGPGSGSTGGDRPVGAQGSAYAGQLQMSVDMNEDETDAVATAFREAGAVEVSCN